jgi:hypothetical protein
MNQKRIELLNKLDALKARKEARKAAPKEEMHSAAAVSSLPTL